MRLSLRINNPKSTRLVVDTTSSSLPQIQEPNDSAPTIATLELNIHTHQNPETAIKQNIEEPHSKGRDLERPPQYHASVTTIQIQQNVHSHVTPLAFVHQNSKASSSVRSTNRIPVYLSNRNTFFSMHTDQHQHSSIYAQQHGMDDALLTSNNLIAPCNTWRIPRRKCRSC